MSSDNTPLEQQVLDWKPNRPPSQSELDFAREIILGQAPLGDLLLRSAEMFIYANAYDADIAKALVQKTRTAIARRTFDDLLIANLLLTEMTSMWAETDTVLPLALDILDCTHEDVLDHLLHPCAIAIGRASNALKDDRLREKLFEKAQSFQDRNLLEYANNCAVGVCLATGQDTGACFDMTFDRLP